VIPGGPLKAGPLKLGQAGGEEQAAVPFGICVTLLLPLIYYGLSKGGAPQRSERPPLGDSISTAGPVFGMDDKAKKDPSGRQADRGY